MNRKFNNLGISPVIAINDIFRLNDFSNYDMYFDIPLGQYENYDYNWIFKEDHSIAKNRIIVMGLDIPNNYEFHKELAKHANLIIQGSASFTKAFDNAIIDEFKDNIKSFKPKVINESSERVYTTHNTSRAKRRNSIKGKHTHNKRLRR